MTDDFLSAKASTSPQPVKNAGNLLLGALLLSTFLASLNLTCFELRLRTVYKWTPPQFRCFIPRRELRHAAVKWRSALLLLLTLPSPWMKKWKETLVPRHWARWRPSVHIWPFLQNLFGSGVFPGVQSDSRLSGRVSGLPQETSVDFVSCLKAFAVCGFLTCQSTILRGLGESCRLGDGPPRIYAEHIPNKKMQREHMMGTKRWHKGILIKRQGTLGITGLKGSNAAKTLYLAAQSVNASEGQCWTLIRFTPSLGKLQQSQGVVRHGPCTRIQARVCFFLLGGSLFS